MSIGEQIYALRKQQGLTQGALADRLYVTPQAVSQWECGITIPDTDKLGDIAAVLHTTVNMLTGGEVQAAHNWVIADVMFSWERMYSRLVSTTQIEKLPETYAALPYMKEKHAHQTRKPTFFSSKPIPYAIHPLMMACHAHALGIREDKILAAVLLHDVCEDCGVSFNELPFTEDVREAVRLLSFVQESGETKAQAKKRYYAAIAENRIACIVKILDRCNNISTMASSFSQEKLNAYIDETEQYILPILDRAKYSIPEYADALYVIKYHMRSILETIKAMSAR